MGYNLKKTEKYNTVKGNKNETYFSAKQNQKGQNSRVFKKNVHQAGPKSD